VIGGRLFDQADVFIFMKRDLSDSGGRLAPSRAGWRSRDIVTSVMARGLLDEVVNSWTGSPKMGRD